MGRLPRASATITLLPAAPVARIATVPAATGCRSVSRGIASSAATATAAMGMLSHRASCVACTNPGNPFAPTTVVSVRHCCLRRSRLCGGWRPRPRRGREPRQHCLSHVAVWHSDRNFWLLSKRHVCAHVRDCDLQHSAVPPGIHHRIALAIRRCSGGRGRGRRWRRGSPARVECRLTREHALLPLRVPVQILLSKDPFHCISALVLPKQLRLPHHRTLCAKVVPAFHRARATAVICTHLRNQPSKPSPRQHRQPASVLESARALLTATPSRKQASKRPRPAASSPPARAGGPIIGQFRAPQKSSRTFQHSILRHSIL